MAHLSLLAGLVLASAQSPFQGVVTGTYYGDAGTPAVEYTQSIKGQRVRMDMSMSGMSMSSLVDIEAGTVTSLMHEQRKYMVINFNQVTGQAGGAPKMPKITATGRRETIAGINCEHYLINIADQQDMDVCAAKGMGFGSPQGGGRGTRGPAAALPVTYEELAQQFKDGFFPLKIERVRGSERRLVMQVKAIERKALPDATFAMPAGYTEMKIPGMP